MGKRTRIILYALSLVTMLAMVTLIIFSHGRQSGEPAKMRCPRRISAARRNRFRYRKRKSQKRRKQQTGRTGSKTIQNRKKWT